MSLEVLLPFDGSPASLQAANYLARNLEHVDARVHVLNVQRAYIDAEMIYSARAIVQMHREEAEALMLPALALLERHGVKHTAEVAFGPPAPVIARIAEDRGCGLIVMGTRARNPLVEFLARSIAARVRRAARVPVLLVREDTSTHRHPLFNTPTRLAA